MNTRTALADQLTELSPVSETSAPVKTSGVDLSLPVAIALDYFCIGFGMLAGIATYGLIRSGYVPHENFKLVLFSIQYLCAFFLFGRMHSLYDGSASLLNIRATAGILRVSTFCLVLFSFGLTLSQAAMPRFLLLLCWGWITLFLIIQKQATSRTQSRLRNKQRAARNVLIVGSGSDARRAFSYLSASPEMGMNAVGFLEMQEAVAPGTVIYAHDYTFKDSAPVFSGPLDEDLLKTLNISEVLIAAPDLSASRMADITTLAKKSGVKISVTGQYHPLLPAQLSSVKEIDGLLISSYSDDPTRTVVYYEFWKRVGEFFIALLLIVATSPLWFAIALWVRLSSKGPVFFRQTRIGRDGKEFDLYKFRSMYITAPKYGRSPEDSRDPRITSAGRFLRKTSLDELPQLLNVLRGDMALVGPRPEMPYVVDQYNERQMQRLSVTPGVTGLWQLSADRKFAIHESIEYDLYYIENRGFFLDVAVLLHTAAFAMKGI